MTASIRKSWLRDEHILAPTAGARLAEMDSSWRALVAASASPVQSSRLTRNSTPRPAPRRGAASSGMGGRALNGCFEAGFDRCG